MENNRKHKGFMKGKLVMSLYRATKPSYTLLLPHHQYNAKVVKQTTRCPLHSSTSLVGYIVNHDKVTPQPKQTRLSSPCNNDSSSSAGFIVDPPQSKQKVSFLIADNNEPDYPCFDNNNNNKYLNDPYGVAGDEGVDLKAASYISCVQERFRLERVNSECKKSQDKMIMQ